MARRAARGARRARSHALSARGSRSAAGGAGAADRRGPGARAPRRAGSRAGGARSEHPLRERLRGQLMLALYRSGRQAEALEAYRTGRRLLDEELGLEPGEELRRLERAILEQDESLSAPASPPREAPGGGAPDRHGHVPLHGHRGLDRLVQELGEDYAALLEQHHRLVRGAFEEYGGEEVDLRATRSSSPSVGHATPYKGRSAATRSRPRRRWPTAPTSASVSASTRASPESRRPATTAGHRFAPLGSRAPRTAGKRSLLGDTRPRRGRPARRHLRGPRRAPAEGPRAAPARVPGRCDGPAGPASRHSRRPTRARDDDRRSRGGARRGRGSRTRDEGTPAAAVPALSAVAVARSAAPGARDRGRSRRDHEWFGGAGRHGGSRLGRRRGRQARRARRGRAARWPTGLARGRRPTPSGRRTPTTGRCSGSIRTPAEVVEDDRSRRRRERGRRRASDRYGLRVATTGPLFRIDPDRTPWRRRCASVRPTRFARSRCSSSPRGAGRVDHAGRGVCSNQSGDNCGHEESQRTRQRLLPRGTCPIDLGIGGGNVWVPSLDERLVPIDERTGDGLGDDTAPGGGTHSTSTRMPSG